MRRALAPIAVAMIVATGCSGAPDDGRSASPGPAVDRAGAPAITAPRDVGERGSAPCRDLLDADQLRRLGLDPGGRPERSVVGAASCTWTSARTGRRVDAAMVHDPREDFFVETYRRRITAVFVPHDVGGLPAVDLQYSAGSSSCTTTVGLADFRTLDVNVAVGYPSSGEREADSCAISRRVAEEIVSTLLPLPR